MARVSIMLQHVSVFKTEHMGSGSTKDHCKQLLLLLVSECKAMRITDKQSKNKQCGKQPLTKWIQYLGSNI